MLVLYCNVLLDMISVNPTRHLYVYISEMLLGESKCISRRIDISKKSHIRQWKNMPFLTIDLKVI